MGPVVGIALVGFLGFWLGRRRRVQNQGTSDNEESIAEDSEESGWRQQTQQQGGMYEIGSSTVPQGPGPHELEEQKRPGELDTERRPELDRW